MESKSLTGVVIPQKGTCFARCAEYFKYLLLNVVTKEGSVQINTDVHRRTIHTSREISYFIAQT